MRRISTLFPILTILSSVSLIGLSVHSTPAHAQENDGAKKLASATAGGAGVTVRGSVQDDYTRLVFESASQTSYIADTSGSTLTITFQKPVTLNTTGQAPSSLPRITAYTVPDSTHVKISYAAGQDVRHFTIGNKIIVDIRGPVTAAKPAEKPVEKVAEKPESKPQPKPTEPVAPVKPTTPPAAVATTPAQPPAAAGAEDTAEQVAEVHTIQLASTEAINLAAFERAGRFWIVVDQPNYLVPVQVEGPRAKEFKPFQSVQLQEATAFWTELPANMQRSAEGGGLVWKILLSPTQAEPESIPLERRFGSTAKSPASPGLHTAEAPAVDGSTAGSLVWPAKTAQRVIDMEDPVVGDTIKVITVQSAGDVLSRRQNFPELMVLPATMGMALVPKIDTLDIAKSADGIVITRPGKGLSISPNEDVLAIHHAVAADATKPAQTSETPNAESAKDSAAPNQQKIFDFNRWLMGGEKALEENVQVIMGGIGMKNDQGQAADTMLLGKMELANGHGPEALGYFDLSEQKVPELGNSAEFKALRGAAYAMSTKFDMAFADLSDPGLKNFAEVDLWRSYTLASLEDWDQAEKVMPDDLSLLETYPASIRDPIALALGEVALRAGNPDQAEELLQILSSDETVLQPSQQAAYAYLQGELARQRNEIDKTKEKWDGLTKGTDDLYRAKAGLALTTLLVSRKEMPPATAIDKLEGLRYAWRGDELETAINFRLGQMYIDNNDYLRGLATLRQAMGISPDTEQSKKIGVYMSDTFRNLFLGEKIHTMNPLDAVTVYEEFSELLPKGPDSVKIARALAERLVGVDLLPRAAAMLQELVDKKLTGMDAVSSAIRIAQIQIMDKKPQKAIEALNKAESLLAPMVAEVAAPARRDIALLRARALSDQKKPEDAVLALSLLDQDKDVLRLRADIAWQAQRWQDAAEALELLIGQENISLTRPLSDTDADMILNWAVALYLADNRYVLANVRERYDDAMAQTTLAKKFEVVTRPRQTTLLADRETINAIVGEIELFKDFMDVTAKEPVAKPSASAPTSPPAAPAATAPATPPAAEKPAE